MSIGIKPKDIPLVKVGSIQEVLLSTAVEALINFPDLMPFPDLDLGLDGGNVG